MIYMILKGGNNMNKKGSILSVCAIVFVIFIIISFSVLFHFWLGPKVFFKQVNTAHKIVDKTYTAENAIYNYEWFKTQYEKIIAKEKQIDNTALELGFFKEMYGDPKEWDWSTKEEYSRLNTILLGQKNFYEDLVAEYNARSKMANREIFKDKLPFDVDKKIW